MKEVRLVDNSRLNGYFLVDEFGCAIETYAVLRNLVVGNVWNLYQSVHKNCKEFIGGDWIGWEVRFDNAKRRLYHIALIDVRNICAENNFRFKDETNFKLYGRV